MKNSNLNNKIGQFSLQRSFADKDRAALFSQLRILLLAGLDVKQALELLVADGDRKQLSFLKDVDFQLLQGSTLFMAMEKTGNFSNYEIYSIRIGEETGRLPEVLEQLELFFNRKVQLKRQLTTALSYPVLVLFIALGVVYFMLNNIVPMFSEIFSRFGGELPPLTKVLIKLSTFTRSYAWLVMVFLFAGGFFLYQNRAKESVRNKLTKLILKAPYFGKIIQKIYLARFAQVMYLLTSAKVPLTEAISMVEKMIGFYPMEISMAPIRKSLTNGNSLHSSLAKFEIYEKQMVAILKVGEEVNQMDAMFNQLSKQYNDDIDHASKTLTSLIEPVMIVFIAAIVGVILVAMYLPLFKMSTTIQ